MYAVIDIGSNTIRLVIYKVDKGSYNILLNKKEMAALASYVNDRMMSAAGIEKACHALLPLKKIALDLGIENIYAFATAALRNVTNSDQAVKEIEEKTGLKIHVISGKVEAKLDFIGAARTVNLKSGLLIDIGGASTELVAYENMKIKQAVSLPIGSLSAYSKYVNHFFPNKIEQQKIRKKVLHLLEKQDYQDFAPNYQDVCGVGGTIRSTKDVYNSLFGLSPRNKSIRAESISGIIKQFLNKKDKTHIDRHTLDTLLDIVPDRIRTILPGMIILETLVDLFKVKTILISRAGVREGYLAKIILKEFDDIEV
ncbi:phosphatase [Pectinatus cerevisiiphilus]|uniref:Exopolyphosphatase/guanosine-5'-triphosphate, 3'-diphosphate pyrophosphatase n=1 Tax=Pectinatus cerevisiiphilus TaxID=86956 RepID=A0A4R3K9W6_9FIRM|nr:phosphatase [Pectinatus cerevisiiphilus]TCS79683.1 exopolyphosphatase/guanosine-5'-triphosphate,3'-diphosphate pyrophosphatase [Pectinatus cerevisiiphilus]